MTATLLQVFLDRAARQGDREAFRLHLTGRKKELIALSTGKKVAIR